jgi:hypothetical protein
MGADQAVAVPALPLRPFVSHYAGSRMRNVPQWQHAGLPSRYIDLIVSLAGPIEIVCMPGARAAGVYRAFVAGLQQAPALVRMGGDLDCLHVFLNFVRVNVFLDTVRHRADWQDLGARCEASGFESLSAFVNYDFIVAAPVTLFVPAVIGATIGFIGGLAALAGRGRPQVPQ